MEKSLALLMLQAAREFDKNPEAEEYWADMFDYHLNSYVRKMISYHEHLHHVPDN